MDDFNALSLPELFQRLVAGAALERLIDLAIEEDLGHCGTGDITSESIIDPGMKGNGEFVARQGGVVAGLEVLPHMLARFDRSCTFARSADDGQRVEMGSVLGVIEGSMLGILTSERTLLNLLGHLSGIATLARAYVDAVAGTRAVICETRKTTPGLRTLEKYAARCGGVTLHRIGLYDAALYKDNHLAHLEPDQWPAALTQAVKHVRESHNARFVEVEVDTLEQLDRVLSVANRPESTDRGLIDCVLLDNMPRAVLRQAVRMRDECAPGVKLEASGGITLSNVRSIAETGVERISVGAITHSAPALDIALDITNQE